jgi:pyruvate/2-oxoglutarate dehydrogenase complex dihydrolipoamide acyltransferase (E2) component
MLRRLGKVFLLGVLVGLAVALVRALTRGPDADALPSAPIGRSLSPPPRPEPVASPGPAADAEPEAEPEPVADPGRGAAEPEGRVLVGDTFVAVEEPDPEPDTTDDGERILRGESFVAVEPAPPHGIEAAPPHAVDTTWVSPIDGECPPGYPVKAKLGSRIYHRPGGLSYERTRPDRCYPSPEAAEADGFRAAKR